MTTTSTTIIYRIYYLSKIAGWEFVGQTFKLSTAKLIKNEYANFGFKTKIIKSK